MLQLSSRKRERRSAFHSAISIRSSTTAAHLVDLPPLPLPRADPAIEHDPPALRDPRLVRLRPPLKRLGDVLRERLGNILMDLALELGLSCKNEKEKEQERSRSVEWVQPNGAGEGRIRRRHVEL